MTERPAPTDNGPRTPLPAETPAAPTNGPFAENPAGRSPTVISLGGDNRQTVILSRLKAAGYPVRAVGLGQAAGLPPGVRLVRTPQSSGEWDCLLSAPDGAPVLLLPLPLTRDGVTVSCPLDPEAHIPLADVESALKRAAILRAALTQTGSVRVLGGCLPDGFADRMRRAVGAGCVADYCASEAVLQKNARLSAEGAVMTVMELTDTALIGSRMAVIGYGRIGRQLARLLVGLGVRVTVLARRAESLAGAWSDGCRTVPLTPAGRAEADLAHGYDVILNTVPVCLFGRGFWDDLDVRTHVVDLASPPGCLPAGYVPRKAQVVQALSLPGRYAPRTAGELLADEVLSLLDGGSRSQRDGREEGR